MNTTPRYEKEDILVNFRDLLVHILRRWRSIVIVTLIITILVGGLRYGLDWRRYTGALNAADNETSITLEGLSLANANQVLQYQKLYQAQADYNRTAPLMQIDPAMVNTETLSYLITGPKCLAAAELYRTHLGDTVPYADISDSANPALDAAHIQELVTVTLQKHDTITTPDHTLLTIKIIAPSNPLRTAIAHTVRDRMTALQSVVAQAIGDHTLSLAADTVQTCVDTTLKTTQQNNLNACNTLRTNLKSSKDALSSAEKAYVEQMTSLDNNPDTNSTPTPPSINKKWLVLGLAVGLVMMLGIYGLGYVFSQTLKSREDFAERYGLYVFGSLSSADKPVSATERLIRRAFFKSTGTPAAAMQQLRYTAKTALADRSAATVLVLGNTDPALFTETTNALAADGITLAIPSDEAAALEELATADAAVLAETIGQATYGEIYRTLELCDRLNTPVLGAFISE